MITIKCPTAYFAEDRMVFALSGNQASKARIEYYFSNKPLTQDSAYILGNGTYGASNIYNSVVTQAPVTILTPVSIYGMAYRPIKADVTFFLEPGIERATANFTIFAGKSSEALHASLIASGTSLAERKMNGQSSPLLSTKTSTNLIALRESEVCPLFFIPKPEGNNSLVVKNEAGGVLLNGAIPEGVVGFVNLSYLIAQYKTNLLIIEYNGWPTYVAVEKDRPALHTRVVTFRNSFAVFEKIALTGKASTTATFNESTFSQYNTASQSFELRQNRRQVSHAIRVYAGYKNREELNFILDMLNSEEVYLSDTIGELGMRVIPSVGEYKYTDDLDDFEPREMEISFKPAINNSAFTPL